MIGPSRGGRRASVVKTTDGRCGDEVKQGAILGTPERVLRIFYLEETNSLSVYSSKRFTLSLAVSVFTLCFLLLSASYAAGMPKRIISLAPNMTELLFALGLGDRVVGVTTYCDYPAEAKKRPKIGGMSNPSMEAVIALRPAMVVMTVDGNPKEFKERLRSFGIKTYVFRAKRIREFPEGVRDLGIAMGVPERSDKLATEIEVSLDNLGKSSRAAQRPSRKKKVLFIVWPAPLIVAGHGSIADDAMTILGMENIAAGTRSAYPKFSIEEILRKAPDVIFIGRGRGMQEVSAGLLRRLKTVPAVKNGKVFYVGDYLYRLTPRTIKGIEELAECLDR
jgi:iron complex transport system substrate-binding protein